ncbi:hypothetical protein [Rhizobium leguminosarum]|nr:hypothetical protein [Rhizobium leguminosarum]
MNSDSVPDNFDIAFGNAVSPQKITRGVRAIRLFSKVIEAVFQRLP